MTAEIYDARPCELGEGPLWHPVREQLFWFDILGKRMLSQTGGRALDWPFDECVSAAGWIDRDTLLIASETGLYRFDIDSGEQALITPLEADRTETRSNDGRADPMGGFWIGTMGKAAEPGAGGLFRWYDGRLQRLRGDLTIPNAICFSPDGRTAHFADTATGRMMRWRLDRQGWPEAEPDLFIDLTPEGLSPDGAVVDAEGCLWNAQWGAGRVARYLPDGRFDCAVKVGGRLSSCPAFGGPGLSTLFVTTAREGLTGADRAQGPVYAVVPGVSGRPEPAVRI